MSLSLIQGYSSEEEEEEAIEEEDYEKSSEEEEEVSCGRWKRLYKPPSNPSQSSSFALPSVLDAFSQVSGPPQFLSNSVEEYGAGIAVAAENNQQRQGKHARWRNKDNNNYSQQKGKKKDLPAGAVLEAKSQLVGFHEQVRSDIEAPQPPSSVSSTTQEGGKQVPVAANLSAEDAADLLRMCLQCGVPKTYSGARGMVCPICGDRPPDDTSKEMKKKGSAIKDKEKSKRMKGQSSHATWKSETEMQLRQQFD